MNYEVHCLLPLLAINFAVTQFDQACSQQSCTTDINLTAGHKVKINAVPVCSAHSQTGLQHPCTDTVSAAYPIPGAFAGAEVAEQMRYRVFNETQLTCSVGLGPNTMLAKVASDINKPNGQYVLPEDPAALKEFVQSLSLRKVPGIGKVRNACSVYVKLCIPCMSG